MSLSARSARWSGCRRSRSTSSARPTTIPACGPPSSLSPEKQTSAGAGGEALACLRLVAERHERARAEIVDEHELARGRDVGELRERRVLREADDAEVRLVHAQQHGRLGPGGSLVVGGARPVRRSHLDEAGARAREHVGDAEAVADLDQLAARDEHLAALREGGQGQQHGGCVVVDDERRFGARQPAEDGRHVILARAARPCPEVVLEVRIAASDVGDALERRSPPAVPGRGSCARSPRWR